MNHRPSGLLFLFLLAKVAVYAQPLEPARGAKVIELTTTLPDSVMYRTIGHTLLEEGYTFKSDKALLLFITTERPLPDSPAFHYSANLVIHQGTIKITGVLRNTLKFTRRKKTVVDKGKPIDYRTGKNDMRGPAFTQLDELAHALTVPMVTTITAYSKR
ncbi:hypothetical protein EXU85_00655 [Spirosoma sp. KCTC 42546]|uniref:hypothetical protein n=1 Tax=Spirosoma sp. KCTC 42546 TaxID=2520506 RepID=UPI0011580B99|nr:hypothetical protein [Spirosoma sp. KCTC 42546]QDK77181.1 hypothetical protein EXU85_00655 [Spirosoma sp. KCTC 42546]